MCELSSLDWEPTLGGYGIVEIQPLASRPPLEVSPVVFRALAGPLHVLHIAVCLKNASASLPDQCVLDGLLRMIPALLLFRPRPNSCDHSCEFRGMVPFGHPGQVRVFVVDRTV